MLRTSILFFALVAFPFAAAGETPRATRIIQGAESVMRGKSIQALMSMRIRRQDYTRELSVRAWTSGQTHALVEILDPVKELGVTSLRVEDQMWNYLPKTGQTVRVPGSMMLQGWMGSDFTNDDLMKASSLSRDYTHKILKNQKLGKDKTIVIECIPKPGAPVVWGKVHYWARVLDGLPLMQRFYDEDGKLVRTLSFGKFKKMDDRIIPTVISVHNNESPGQMTVIQYQKVIYDRRIPKRLFAREHLSRTSEQGKNPIAHWYYSPLSPPRSLGKNPALADSRIGQ